MLDRLFTIFLGTLSTLFFPIRVTCNLLLLGLGVHGTADELDREKYRRFRDTKGKAVIIFNHPTFYDHMVIMKELNDVPRFAMAEKYMLGPLKWIAKYYNVLTITNAKGNSAAIQGALEERPVLIVAPAGGYCHRTDSAILEEFKTGSFLNNPLVLPIIINYTPFEPWAMTDSLHSTVLNRLLGKEIQYRMKVLDPVMANQDETPHNFAQRCRELMEAGLRDLKNNMGPQVSSGSSLCLTTSFLFLLSSIATAYKGAYLYSTGMFTTFVTSVLYHATHDRFLRTIDIASNLFWMLFCSTRLYTSYDFVPLAFLSIAVLSYYLKINHAYGVHVPITLGFLSIKSN